MVKIQITIEEPNDEWNQLIKIANKDKTILGYLLQREDVELWLETIPSVPVAANKMTEVQQDAPEFNEITKKQLEREINKREKDKEREKKIHEIFESSFSIDEVQEKVKESKINKFKRNAIKAWNKEHNYNLPIRTPKWVPTEHDVGFCRVFTLAHYLVLYNLDIDRWPTGAVSLTRGSQQMRASLNLITDIIGEAGAKATKTIYDKENFRNKVIKKILDFMDPSKHPSRGDVNDFIYYKYGKGHDLHTYTKEWATYVLTHEILPQTEEELISAFSGLGNDIASKIFTTAAKHLPDWKVYDAEAFAKKHPTL